MLCACWFKLKVALLSDVLVLVLGGDCEKIIAAVA
jgi:hypothetical protein